MQQQPQKSQPLDQLLQLVGLSNAIQSGQNSTAQLGLDQQRLTQNASQFGQMQTANQDERTYQHGQDTTHNDLAKNELTSRNLINFYDKFAGNHELNAGLPQKFQLGMLGDTASGLGFPDMANHIQAVPNDILATRLAPDVKALRTFKNSGDQKSFNDYLKVHSGDPEASAYLNSQFPQEQSGGSGSTSTPNIPLPDQIFDYLGMKKKVPGQPKAPKVDLLSTVGDLGKSLYSMLAPDPAIAPSGLKDRLKARKQNQTVTNP